MSGDYYALLGVRRDASPAEIRRAYELALQRANRDGAIRHSMELVRAYEVLGDAGRKRLYDSTGRAVLPERVPNTHGRAVPWRGGWPAIGQTMPRRARHAQATAVLPSPRRGFTLKVLALPVLVTAAVLAAVAVNQPADPMGEPSPQTKMPVVVPANARIGPDGRVLVSCDRTAAGPAYAMRVPRGTAVACTNGATPRW